MVDAIILEIVPDFNYLFDTGITAHEHQWFAACAAQGQRVTLSGSNVLGLWSDVLDLKFQSTKNSVMSVWLGIFPGHLKMRVMSQNWVRHVTKSVHSQLVLCCATYHSNIKLAMTKLLMKGSFGEKFFTIRRLEFLGCLLRVA